MESFALIKKIVWERDKYICKYCGENMEQGYKDWKEGKIKRKYAKLSVDHVKPRCAGGTWELENLVTSCFKCNTKKSKFDIKMKHLLTQPPKAVNK